MALLIRGRGSIKTPMLSRVYGGSTEDLKPLFPIPLVRFGEADEVAKLFAFLLSDDSSYITGSVHRIDGGILS
jgi:NAD(P)-dependent dehydrogenase (short-subunit alcohol dehydrogenase family)